MYLQSGQRDGITVLEKTNRLRRQNTVFFPLGVYAINAIDVLFYHFFVPLEWRVVKGACFITYEEDISIKWELPFEHHQLLLSSLACTRRAEPKRYSCYSLSGTHTMTETHLHTLSNAAKCAHVVDTVCTHTQTHTHTHTSAAQWGTSIQLA